MTHVSVVGYGYGDGYLRVDTQEWINDRGEYSDDLTDDLRTWMHTHDHKRPFDDVLALWVKDRTGQRPAGLHGDGEMWHLMPLNERGNLLSDEFGFVVFSSGGLGQVMIVVSDHHGCYVLPEVYRSLVSELEGWADYSRAMGECAKGHRWLTEDTVRLHRDDAWNSDTYRVSGQVRVPFDDRERAYVACPECRKAIRFDTF